MRKLIQLLILLPLLIIPVRALDVTAPPAPDGAIEYMPENTETFADGLWYILKQAINGLMPNLAAAAGSCLSVIAISILTSILMSFASGTKRIIDLVSVMAIGLALLEPANTLIRLGISTITELTEYGKLLIPVMAAALAAQGGASSSAALYSGTILFTSLLTTLITSLLIPMLYIFLCLSVAGSATGNGLLKGIQGFVKWLKTWALKIILYVFTGYMGITGVISGSADAAAIRATKLAISGAVPVVGSILSDASETILVGASLMKNAAGVYGTLAILATLAAPFMTIAAQYLLLKATSGICGVFTSKAAAGLIKDFSSAMGYLLAMTGTVCLILLISTVCFMRGVS